MEDTKRQFNVRSEVMQTIEPQVDGFIDQYLISPEDIWQPADLLPDSTEDNFFEKIEELQECAKDLDYNFWIVLVGDTITEEALPTYESWLSMAEGVDFVGRNSWSRWVTYWSAEENRHGDLLNKYLYLSGRVNMREVEVSTQYLISDGFDIGTDRDPYRNFIYTSFQELATNISHKRVAKLAASKGNALLSKMCTTIAGDEMRHYLAYREFVKTIFNYDANEMMLAFEDMMKKKITMPAHYLRESGKAISDAFVHFSNVAQQLNVYTFHDYVDILNKLLKYWQIDAISDLDDNGKRARDYLMRLPSRLTRIAERMTVPDAFRQFSWVSANGVLH